MFEVSVFVTPKQGILDPQGATIERALPALGFEGVENIRVGRFITLEIDGEEEEAVRNEVDAMCRRLLANPIIEDYRFQIEGATAVGGEDIIVSEDTPLHEAGEHAGSPHTAADPYASHSEDAE